MDKKKENMTIENLVNPLNSGEPYLRPFIGDAINKEFGVFLVGINPATPIGKSEIDNIKEFAGLIQDKEKFLWKYEEIRKAKGKAAMSKTRKAIEQVAKKVAEITNLKVLETNVIPYPTSNVKELKRIDKASIEYAKSKFTQILLLQQPQIILLHGKKTLMEFIKIAHEQNFIINTGILDNLSKTELEEKIPLFTFCYIDKAAPTMVFYCRHLRYYGEKSGYFNCFFKKLGSAFHNGS